MKNVRNLLILLVALSAAAFAQVTGSLTGTVTDQSDAGIADATVQVFLPGGADPILTGSTTSNGRFTFAAINPDQYDITVQARGFTSLTYRAVRVSPRLETALPPLKLQLQTVSTTIEVVADAQALPTEDAQIATTITAAQIQNLPVLGRQITTLFQTQPGVTNGAGAANVNGLRTSLTNVTLDGVNIQDNFLRTNGLDYAPFRTTIDQIEEITFTTSNAAAQFGNGASQVAMVTRSGTNDFHGSVYWYNRNAALSAKDWFSNRDNIAKAKLNLNQPGFSLGGPVPLSPHKLLKDKLFFFTTYEWYRDKRTRAEVRTVLTDSAKQGIFTYNDTAGVRRTADLKALRNFAINPTIAGLIAQLPAPNSTGGDGLNTSGYRFNAAFNEFRDQFVYKSDYYITPNHVLTGSINKIENPTQRPDVTTSFYTTQPNVNNILNNLLVSLQYRWVISPTLTNEVHGGFARTKGNFDVTSPYTPFVLAGLSFTNPSNTFLAQGRQTNNYPIQDNATWVKNNHIVNFGYQYALFNTTPFNDGGIVPSYTLGISTANTTGLTTANLPGIRTSDLATANGLYANLAGIISSAAQTFNVTSATSGYVNGATNLRELDWATHSLYFQDNWKLTRNLTVNLGLRYEYWTALDEKNGLYLSPVLKNNDAKATMLDPNATLDFIGGPSGRPFYKSDKNNFAPNLGMAWTIAPKTVLRGGYSISFVNDNLISTVRNNVGTANGLQSAATLPNLTATLANAPTIPTPAYKVPRTLADNYALSTTSALGLPDPNLVTPSVHQWNVSLEHDLGGFLLSARYIGNRSTNLLRAIDYNQILYNANGFLGDFLRAQSNGDRSFAANGTYDPRYNAAIAGSQPLTVFPQLASGGLLTNATVINLVRTGQVASLADIYMTNRLNGSVNFYTNPNIQGANAVVNGGWSNFNSLQLQATRRTRNGLQVQFSYVFSKGLSTAAGDAGTNFEPLLDNANPGLEKQRSPFDLRHVFKANYVYELPFGQGKRWSGNRLINRAIGGWVLSGIWNYQSGVPFSVLSGYGTFNRGGRSTATNTASVANIGGDQLQSLVSGTVYKTGGGTVYFVNPSIINTDGRATNQAGTAAYNGQVFYNPLPGTVGNLQRRAFSGPWDFQWDMSVAKRVSLTERQMLELHFDFFNVFNVPTWSLRPSSNGDFGTTANYTINNTTFGQVNAMNRDARQIQIGARYSF